MSQPEPKYHIEFNDEENYKGKGTHFRTDVDMYKVPVVDKSTAKSIWVYSGYWLLYSGNDFTKDSYLLSPGDYKTQSKIEEKRQSPGKLPYRGEIRSLRLVTPDSLILFEKDYYCDAYHIIQAKQRRHIECSDAQSLIVAQAEGSTPKAAQLDLVFVIDGSGSIFPVNFEMVKAFAANLSCELNISAATTRVGMVQYATDATVQFMLNEHNTNDAVKKAILNVKQKGGSTYTGQALTTVRTDMDWRGSPCPAVAIVVTDGASNDEVVAPADALRNAGVDVYAVGVKIDDIAVLNEISGDESKTFSLQNHEELDGIIKELAEKVQNVPLWRLYQHGEFHVNEGVPLQTWDVSAGKYTKKDIKLPAIASAERFPLEPK